MGVPTTLCVPVYVYVCMHLYVSGGRRSCTSLGGWEVEVELLSKWGSVVTCTDPSRVGGCVSERGGT